MIGEYPLGYYSARHVLNSVGQASATYGTRAKRGTWNDFQ